MSATNIPSFGLNETDPVALMLRLIDVATQLSSEQDHEKLLEKILTEAQIIANADGATLYVRTEDDHLRFVIMRTDSLGIAYGGTSGNRIPFPPIPLYDPATKKPNYSTQSVFSALMGKNVNIEDVYSADGFDFAGTKRFDEANNYRCRSVLTIPLKARNQETIGVLQLVNARNLQDDVIPFSKDIERIIGALASLAAVSYNNQMLIHGQKELLDAFIQVIAGAIDAKSPYTGGHCSRVPLIAEMLADAGCKMDHGTFKHFNLTEEERYELHIAAWLHDCGKIVTPVHVMDKSTKLETIFDRIELIKTRVELAKREAQLAYYSACEQPGADKPALEAALDADLRQLEDEYHFIENANIGGEFMADAMIERIKQIASKTCTINGVATAILSENEVYNLSVRRGTLTAEERKIINDHMVVTLDILERLPFPKHLKRVPEIAGGHHEKMDGTGYPRGLKGHEMSTLAKMMAVADVFEALTANDRPYKKAKTLSETMQIMGTMKRTNHLDPDVFNLFVESGCYRDYATQQLDASLIDEVDEAALIAITPEPMKHAG